MAPRCRVGGGWVYKESVLGVSGNVFFMFFLYDLYVFFEFQKITIDETIPNSKITGQLCRLAPQKLGDGAVQRYGNEMNGYEWDMMRYRTNMNQHDIFFVHSTLQIFLYCSVRCNHHENWGHDDKPLDLS